MFYCIGTNTNTLTKNLTFAVSVIITYIFPGVVAYITHSNEVAQFPSFRSSPFHCVHKVKMSTSWFSVLISTTVQENITFLPSRLP